MRAALPASAALLLLACGSSPPTRYFTLDPIAAGRAPARSVRGAPIRISAVHVPPELDRRSLVRLEPHNGLAVSPQDRWGADLGELVRNVLTEDLVNRLPSGMVIPARSPAPQQARGLNVNILSFEPEPDGTVVLEATWAIVAGSPPAPQLTRTTRLTEPADRSASGQAAAMSRLLGQLADEITAAMQS